LGVRPARWWDMVGRRRRDVRMRRGVDGWLGKRLRRGGEHWDLWLRSVLVEEVLYGLVNVFSLKAAAFEDMLPIERYIYNNIIYIQKYNKKIYISKN
jgi:hypothetical protein